MIKTIQKNLAVRWIILGLVLVFLFSLKSYNYDRFPVMGHLEEYAYSWMGIHLIEDRLPQTWSPTGHFSGQDIVFSGTITGSGAFLPVDILSPWLDLPPLYGLISGGVAHLFQADSWSVIPASYIRLPAILMSFLTTILIFLLTKRLFGFWTALLAITIYSLTPVFVFGSRLSVAENGITLLYIMVIYLTDLYRDKPKRWYLLVALPMLVGLAGLMKPNGFLITGLIVFLLGQKRLWREAFWVLLGVLPWLGLFLAYGYSLDWPIFQTIIAAQSNRPVGFLGLPFIFSSPGYSTELVFDGWYVFCLLSVFYLLVAKFKDSKYQLVGLGFLFWALVVVVSAGQTDTLLWYHYPFFPFLAISGALLLKETISSPNLFNSLLIILLLLSGKAFLSNDFISQVKPLPFRLIVALLTLPVVLNYFFPSSNLLKLAKLVLLMVVIVGLFFNAQYIFSAFPLISQSKSFPIGPGNALSDFHLPLIWRVLSIR